MEANMSLDDVKAALDNAVVVPFPKSGKDGKRKWDRMWGREVVSYGYVAVPRLILEGQRRLGLSSTHAMVLLHLCNYWWEPDKKPWPAKRKLAHFLNLGERQIQRIIGELEDAGFLKRNPRFRADARGQTSNEYDLSGLVRKLQALEPEFREARKQAAALRQRVQRPGGLKSDAT
jgi:predicted transcriptional regulator